MENRIAKLENSVSEIREKVGKIEVNVESIDKHLATKADLASLESTLTKWFVSTSFALAAFAGAVAFGFVRVLAA